ncbi:hypothetical protein ACQQ2N_04630 [Dokdonella sp. MW10]|uniref:hypothetical protein n=1 Tax=Dokdonella sp. MW10 TaxID=2992926 RepID=UPI003F822627
MSSHVRVILGLGQHDAFGSDQFGRFGFTCGDRPRDGPPERGAVIGDDLAAGVCVSLSKPSCSKTSVRLLVRCGFLEAILPLLAQIFVDRSLDRSRANLDASALGLESLTEKFVDVVDVEFALHGVLWLKAGCRPLMGRCKEGSEIR